MKNVLSIIIAVLLIVGFAHVKIQSQEVFRETRVLSYNTSRELIDNYTDIAEYNLPMHLHNLIEAGQLEGNPDEYFILNGFSPISELGNNLFVFPVFRDRKIAAIFEIRNIDDNYYCQLSIGFAEKLNKLLQKNLGDFAIVYDDEIAYAVNENSTIVLDNPNRLPAKASLNEKFNEISNYSEKSDIVSISPILFNESNLKLRYVSPDSEKILNVRGVKQTASNCWAANCAALINYLKYKNLSCDDVAKTIQPNNPNGGATTATIKRAYEHWGVSPREEWHLLRPSDVKYEIDGYYPIDCTLERSNNSGWGFVQHQVGLIGYTFWGSDLNYEKNYTILNPQDARASSVTVRDNNSFFFYVYDRTYEWTETITLRP